MVQPQTTNLPHEQQQRLHPAFVANEQAYWKIRATLLPQYQGQWVAVSGGQVIAVGTNVLEVMDKASQADAHSFFALAGAEDSAVFRVRRAVYAYDQAYQPFALPRIGATFWNYSGTRSHQLSDVIPDTGADVTLLTDADCKAIDLYNSPCLLGTAAGVLGATVNTLFYQGKVDVDGQRFAALIQAVPGGQERILGRDVLNQQRVLFDGPAGQVVIDP